MFPSQLDAILLDMVRLIPPGNLTSYSDLSVLAAELGFPCTARRVAQTLSRFGSAVPWWRVVQAGGTIAEQILEPALPQLAAEGVPVTGRRVPLEQVRWTPDLATLRSQLSA